MAGEGGISTEAIGVASKATAKVGAEKAGYAAPAMSAARRAEVIGAVISHGQAGTERPPSQTAGPISSADIAAATGDSSEGGVSVAPKDSGQEVSLAATASAEAGTLEDQPKAQESRIPDNVLADKSFIEIRDQLHSQAEQSGKVDADSINREALDKYYGQWAEATFAKGIPDEINNDPRFKELVDEGSRVAAERGEAVDGERLQKDALAKYQREKDMSADSQPQAEKLEDANELRIKALEAKIESLSAENARLSEKLTQLTQAVSELMPMIKALTEKQLATTENEEEKQSLLEMLVLLAKIAVMSVFKEVETEAHEEVQGQTNSRTS